MKERIIFALAFVLVFCAIYVQAQAPTPNPQHKKLGFWIGTWKIEGEGKETPMWLAGKYYATMTAEWFEGRFHVILHTKWSGAMGDYSELGILGYDPGFGKYYQYAIDEFGTGLAFYRTVKENVWTYITDTKVEGKPVKFRHTVVDEL